MKKQIDVKKEFELESRKVTFAKVRELFDLDAERGFKDEYRYRGDLSIPSTNTYTKKEDFIAEISADIDDGLYVSVTHSYDGIEIELYEPVKRDENDTEVVERLQKETRDKIKKIKSEEKEYDEYLRLKEKFEQ